MVPTQQLSSSSSAAQLAPSAGKISQKQAGDDEAFASLLGMNNGNATEAGPDSSTASAGVAQPPAWSPSNGQQTKPSADDGTGQPSGTSGTGEATAPAVEAQPPVARRASLPASDLAFLSRSFYAIGTPPGAAPVRVAAGTSAKTGTSADTKNAKEASGDPSQAATPAATQIDVGANGSLAVLAAQIQNAPAPQTAVEQGQGAEQALIAGAAGGGSGAGRAGSRGSANTQALPQASGFVSGGDIIGMPDTGSSGQGQAMPADGTPPAAATLSNAASGFQSAGGAPSKPAADAAAQGVTVTDVRTYLAPERQTAKLQVQEGASGAGSSLPTDLHAVPAAASSTGQAGQPATVTGSTGSHRDPSGGDTPASPQTVKPAVQSSETDTATGTAPTASLSSQTASPAGQAAPPPAQQIFNAIQSAMSEAASAQPAAQTGNPSIPSGYQPLKTITIALQPDGLGTVAIQLSLRSSHLGVRVEASEAGTAQLLRQHDGDLTALLQSAGYAVSSIAVHAAPQQAPAEGAAQQAGTGGQGGFNPSNPEGRGTGGGSSGTQGEGQRQPGSRNEQREGGYGRPDTANSDKSLYV